MATGLRAVTGRSASAAKGRAGIKNVLETFAFEGQRFLQAYPPAQPWKGPTPMSGLRKGGRRTGTLGRNWKIAGRTVNSIEIRNTTPYGVHVQGDPKGGRGSRQTPNMAARGWPNIVDAGESAKKAVGLKADIYPD